MDRAEFLSRTQTLLEQDAFESALDEAKRRLDRNPGDIDALIVQCHACTRLGKLEEASAVIDEVEKTILEMSRIFVSMGDICFKGGLNQEAVKFYRRFLELNPGSDLSRDISGKLKLIESDSPDFTPEADHRETIEHPVTAGFQTLTLVDLYLRQGHLDEAEALLEQMMARNPDSSTLREKLAAVRSATGVQAAKGMNPRQKKKVIEKLGKWLDLLQRRRSYAI